MDDNFPGDLVSIRSERVHRVDRYRHGLAAELDVLRVRDVGNRNCAENVLVGDR